VEDCSRSHECCSCCRRARRRSERDRWHRRATSYNLPPVSQSVRPSVCLSVRLSRSLSMQRDWRATTSPVSNVFFDIRTRNLLCTCRPQNRPRCQSKSSAVHILYQSLLQPLLGLMTCHYSMWILMKLYLTYERLPIWLLRLYFSWFKCKARDSNMFNAKRHWERTYILRGMQNVQTHNFRMSVKSEHYSCHSWILQWLSRAATAYVTAGHWPEYTGFRHLARVLTTFVYSYIHIFASKWARH